MVVMRALKTEMKMECYSVESLDLRKVQMTEMKMECYSVESLDLRKVQMTEMTKAESLGLMTAQMMEIPKDYCSVVKKAQLIK